MFTVPAAFMYPETAAALLAKSRARREAFVQRTQYAANEPFVMTQAATHEVVRASAEIMERRKAQSPLPAGMKDRRFSGAAITGFGDLTERMAPAYGSDREAL